MKTKIFQFALLLTPIFVFGYKAPSSAEKSYQFDNQYNTNPQQNFGDNNGTQKYINQFKPFTQNFDNRDSSRTEYNNRTNVRNGNFYKDSTHIGDNNNGVTYQVHPNSHPYQ